MVDASTAPLWFNILIYIQLYFKTYWYALFPALGGAIPFILVRLFSFPLLTRNPAELIIMFGPTRAKVIRVTSRVLPFFVHKNNLYWFDEPREVGHNLLHIYIEGVNQPITNLNRLNEKEANILSLREFTKQTTAHNIIIPPSFRSFIRSWVLIVNEQAGTVELKTSKEAKMKEKQHYKIGILKRIGLFFVKEVEEKSEVASGANQVLQSVTVQMIRQKVGDVVRGGNFSSRMAYKILKRLRYVEINWIRMLTGEFDWRILIIILLVVVIGVVGWFIMQSLQPGPPPPGVG